MILGEMCVLLLIYCYVAVFSFCAVRYLINICFSLLFSNYSTYFFVIFFLFFVCFVFLFSTLCILRFCIVLCIVSPLYIAVSFLFMYKFTDYCQRVETQLR